jgi:hypothetical protein
MIEKRFSSLSTALIIAIPMGLLTGCAKTTVDDQALTAAIQSKLYSDAATRQAGVGVAVKDGVVTLSGDVPSTEVEQEAMKVANGTQGVRSVTDQMKVNTAVAANAVPAVPEPAPAPAPSNLASKSQASRTPAASSAPEPAPVSPSPASPEPAPAPASTPAPAPKPARPEQVTIAAGTRLAVRTTTQIDSKTAQEGQAYRGSLDSPIVSRGLVIVPAGADVNMVITGVAEAKRIKGNSSLSLRANTLQYQGKTYNLASSVIAEQGAARGKNTAVKTGIGAAAGALIGGLAGGGKGAGIGAAAGGGAGFGWNALTKGQQVKIPAETVLDFRLESPLTLPVSRRSNAE